MRDILLIEKALRDIVAAHGWEWPEKAVLEIPRDEKHGDLATNLATAELLIKALDRGDMEWRELYN